MAAPREQALVLALDIVWRTEALQRQTHKAITICSAHLMQTENGFSSYISSLAVVIRRDGRQAEREMGLLNKG